MVPDRMDFFFDGLKYYTFNIDRAGTGPDNPFRKPQFLILNLALLRTTGKSGDNTVFPQKFIIDYVRVYRQ